MRSQAELYTGVKGTGSRVFAKVVLRLRVIKKKSRFLYFFAAQYALSNTNDALFQLTSL
jgi:hypothetical protein